VREKSEKKELHSNRIVIDFLKGKYKLWLLGIFLIDGATRKQIEEFLFKCTRYEQKNLFLPTEESSDSVIQNFHRAISGIVEKATPMIEMKK